MMAPVAMRTIRPAKYSARQYFSPARIRILKVLRVVFIFLGVLLVLIGSIAPESKNQGIPPVVLSVICFTTAAFVLWVSIYMFGSVQIYESKITTQNYWKRSMDLKNVARLDIVNTRMFGQPVLLPTLYGNDEQTMALLPIGIRFTASPLTPAWSPAQQTELVQRIRAQLKIGGTDAPA